MKKIKKPLETLFFLVALATLVFTFILEIIYKS